jgi:ribonuclease HI
MSKKVLKAYTDGSCLNQKYINDPLKPRIAGIGVFFADDSELNVSEAFELDNPTNIRAELMAVYIAMQIMYDHYQMFKDEIDNLYYKIHIDCKYVIDCFQPSITKTGQKVRPYVNIWKPKLWTPGNGYDNWVKNDGSVPANLEFIVPMYELLLKFDNKLEFVKVAAHKKEPPQGTKEHKHWYGNSKADEFATAASAAKRPGLRPGPK